MAKPRWFVRHGALLAVLLLFLALAAFGARFHWLEEVSGPERDGFVAQVERVLAGHLPNDPFRPPLYALLGAALSFVVGDPFVAARTISNLAVCGLALCAFELARKLRGPVAGGVALALTAINPNLWVFGEHAATDTLFAALAAATLLGAVSYLLEPSRRLACATGLAYGLAAFTRGNAVLLLPTLALAFWLAPPRPRRWSDLGAGAAIAVTTLVPLWLMRWSVFGSPFYDENAKNLWWKLHGHQDWSLLDMAPRTSFAQLLLSEPSLVARGAAHEALAFARWVFPSLVGGWWVAVLLLPAALLAVRARRRPELLLLFGVGSFTLGLAAAFFAWDRLALVWIPVTAALGAAALVELKQWAPRRWQTLAFGFGVAAVLGLTGVRAVRSARAFVARHPYVEVELLRKVEPGLAKGASVAGTAPSLQRYFSHAYVAAPDVFGAAAQDASSYLDALERELRERRVAYLVVSRLELRERPRRLLGEPGTTPPSWLELVEKTEHGALWRVTAPTHVP